MNCTIEIIDDLMCVMDHDGNGYDANARTGGPQRRDDPQRAAIPREGSTAGAIRRGQECGVRLHPVASGCVRKQNLDIGA